MAPGSARGRLALALLGGLAMVWISAGSAAAAPASLQVSPSSVGAGGSVHVSGTCEANTGGFAISHAFLHDATHDFAGVGAASFSTDATGAFSVDAQIRASTAPGTYTVSGRCGGGNFGSATLVVTSGGVPTAVPAGSGGHAATTSRGTHDQQLLLGGIGVLVLAVGAAGLIRLRRPVRF